MSSQEKNNLIESHTTLFKNSIWLNSSEAADYLRISNGSLRQLVYKGILVPYKLGRLSRFKRSELDATLESSLKEIRRGY